MNPKAVGLIVLVALITLAAVVWLVVWFLSRQAGVRRAEFKRMRGERDLVTRALLDIAGKADVYRDIDSPLAAEVRKITRQLDYDRMEITK